VAAGLERYSVHPIARAIVAEAAARGVPLPRSEDVHEEPGAGISGVVDGRRWSLVSAGTGAVRLDSDSATSWVIRLGDAVRADAPQAIDRLTRDGLHVSLLTGDWLESAQQVARKVGIRDVQAHMTPDGKARWIRAEQALGRRVLFAGDGLNDGSALAQADVGVAMGTGAASSVLVADGDIAQPGLAPLMAARRVARACRGAIRFNHGWSVAYNAGAIAAAAAGLVNPLVCAVLMPLSSGVVIWGALRVERTVRRAERQQAA
jgi:P-type E1-E2 ATPase